VVDFDQTTFFLQNFRRLLIFLLFSKLWKQKMFEKEQKNVSTSEKEQKNVIWLGSTTKQKFLFLGGCSCSPQKKILIWRKISKK